MSSAGWCRRGRTPPCAWRWRGEQPIAGGHLPAVFPERRADVLARGDIEAPSPPRRPPFNAPRVRRTKR